MVLVALPVLSQSSLDWSYDYAVEQQTNMTIGIAETAVEQITVEDSTFPVGGVLGVFLGVFLWVFLGVFLGPLWRSGQPGAGGVL